MQDNNCLAVFSPSTCVFIPSSSCFQEKAMKEKVMREKIGCAKLSDGLFFLQPGSDECCFERFPSTYSHMNKSDLRIGGLNSRISLILLWHQRLGHPNFMYLKRIKPGLFNGISLNSLKCETCLYAKQTRTVYPAKVYQESKPFNLIHYLGSI